MPAKLKFDSVKVGDEIPKIVIKGVTRPDFVRYAGASGDFVPLHYDQTFVEAAGIPTVFAQGMFTAGLLSKARHRLRRRRQRAALPGPLRHPRMAGRRRHLHRQGHQQDREERREA